MSRLKHITADDLDASHMKFLARPINLFRVLGNSPGALRVHHEFGEWIRWECNTDGRLRELVILLVGILKKSPYEFSHHVEISRIFDVTTGDVENLFRYRDGGLHGFTEAETLALDMTRQLTDTGEIADDTWDQSAKHFSDEELCDIATIIAFYNYVVLVLSGLRIDVEPDYEKYLTQFPFDKEWA